MPSAHEPPGTDQDPPPMSPKPPGAPPPIGDRLYDHLTSGTNGAYSCIAMEYNYTAGIGTPKGEALATAL